MNMEELEHGKLLTKKNFPNFVETWNYIVNFVKNLKGDYDTSPVEGHITLDNTDPQHPIIRLANGTVGTTGGTGSGDADNCPWKADYLEGKIYRAGAVVGTHYMFVNDADEDGTVEMEVGIGKYYCMLTISDEGNPTLEITTEPQEDATHASILILERDADDNILYYNRSPAFSCWMSYNDGDWNI